MRLQIDYVDVKRVVFDTVTKFAHGTLHINKEELYAKINNEQFASLEIELTRPGDSTRILAVGDITQPRIKADDPERSFPGLWGKLAPVGDGRTIALRGVVVTETFEMSSNIKWILDMSGEAAQKTQFSRHTHIVLVGRPAAGVDHATYCEVLKHAALETCVYLAKTAVNCEPDETEIFEMTPAPTGEDGKPLPKVAYITTGFSDSPVLQTLYYGMSCIGMLPFIIHPNELLDGAMITRYFDPTYYLQHDNVIRELYRRHGKDIDFVGVVFSNGKTNIDHKKAHAMISANMAKHLLHADLVITNKTGMGHCQLDGAFVCEYCEEIGLKTVYILPGVCNFAPGDFLVINSPAVDAAIHSGRNEIVDFPRVDKLIGYSQIPSLLGIDVSGPFNRETHFLLVGNYGQTGDTYDTSDINIKPGKE